MGASASIGAVLSSLVNDNTIMDERSRNAMRSYVEGELQQLTSASSVHRESADRLSTIVYIHTRDNDDDEDDKYSNIAMNRPPPPPHPRQDILYKGTKSGMISSFDR